jgi:hypothetical protein
MIRIRTSILRHRRRLAVIVATAALALALVWTHGAMGSDHMGDAQSGASTVASICLATLELGGALALLGGAVLLLGRRRAGGLHRDGRGEFSAYVIKPTRVRSQPRAGPALLQVFRL